LDPCKPFFSRRRFFMPAPSPDGLGKESSFGGYQR
jgi:hypothetical protein